MIKKFKQKKQAGLVSTLPLLAACNHPEWHERPEPVVVILDFFQTEITHGPTVLQNFFDEFGNDSREVTVIAEDLDEDKFPNPMLRVYQDFEPDVVNASWVMSDVIEYPSIFDYDTLEEGSFQKEIVDTGELLWLNGTTVTASAGNEASTTSSNEPWANSIFPIIVGAYQGSTGDIFYFSNKGPAVVHFYEAGDSFGSYGTSYSAPRVAAHVALIKTEHESISESSVRTILEKNSVYDFDAGHYVQKLDEISNMDPTIDTRVRVEAVFELFEGRNPSQEELDYWIDQVDNHGLNIGAVAREWAVNGVQIFDVPPIERMQAFYHFWLDRESEDSEIVEMFDDLVATKDWNITFDNFIEKEEIDTSYSFVYNNYDVLATEVIA